MSNPTDHTPSPLHTLMDDWADIQDAPPKAFPLRRRVEPTAGYPIAPQVVTALRPFVRKMYEQGRNIPMPKPNWYLINRKVLKLKLFGIPLIPQGAR